MTRDSKALPIANVAMMSAVLGNTKEYHVMLKVILSLPTQDQCAPTDTIKNHSASLLLSYNHWMQVWVELAHPQIHRLIHVAITLNMVDTSLFSPIKSFGNARSIFWAMPMTPATVKPLGPTDTNIPGRSLSCGSF